MPQVATDWTTKPGESARGDIVLRVGSSRSIYQRLAPDPISYVRRIRALSIGPGVERKHFDGLIHSVFDRVCNIELTGGGLVALAAKEVPNAPRTIRLDISPSGSFSTIARHHQPATCRAGVLRLNGLNKTFDLRTATEWRPVPPSDRSRGFPLAKSRSWRRLFSLVDSTPQSDELRAWTGLDWRFKPGNRVLFSRSQILSEMARLIGRGPGLTPAGDDFIAGFLAALHLLSVRSGEIGELLATLEYRVVTWVRQTTDISRWMLQDAVGGRFVEPIFDLSHAIADENPGEDTLEKSAARVVALGHLSGTAMIYGLLSGMVFDECSAIENQQSKA